MNEKSAETQARYRAKPETKALMAQRARERRARNPRYTRDMNLRNKYGMTLMDYESRVFSQGSQCKLCGEQTDRLVVDHDHETDVVRDLLCNGCNVALGLFGDDPARLRQAAEYIERHRHSIAAA